MILEEYGMQCLKAELHEKLWMNEEQMKVMECGVRWAVEARRKGARKKQRRQEEQGQNSGQEHGKQMRFGQEEQREETRAESTDEPKVTGRLAEMRTGRGSAGLVRGREDRCPTGRAWKKRQRKRKWRKRETRKRRATRKERHSGGTGPSVA